MALPLGQEGVVREHFRVASETWGHRYHRRPERMSDLDMQLRKQNVHRLLTPIWTGPDSPRRVLDLGCGSGFVLEGLPPNGASVISMDIVPEMVASAAKASQGNHFVVGDAGTLPLAPNSVEVVSCIGVLEYLPDPLKALRSMHQALHPGGHLVISFPNRISLFRLLSRWESRTERWLVRVRDRLRGRAVQEAAVPKYRHTQWSVGQACAMLESAGFSVVDSAFNTFGLWGWFGRRKASLRFCVWMSKTFHRRSWVSSGLACTMVVLARKPLDAHT